MAGRRAVAVLIVLYLGLDLASPWIPGLFFFANDDLFLGTVVDGKSKTPAPPSGPVAAPRTRPDAGSVDPAPPSTHVARFPWPGLARGGPRARASERSSLPPSPLDDH